MSYLNIDQVFCGIVPGAFFVVSECMSQKKSAKNAKKEESGAVIILEITSHLLFLITATKYLQ